MTVRTRLAIPLLLALLPGVGIPTAAAAQQALRPASRLWIEGTSNKNDWRVDAAGVEGSATLRSGPAGALSIAGGRLTVAAGEMKSGRSVIMDRLMYEALKTTEHPTIVYELASAAVGPWNGGRAQVATKGRLTIAGVTKDIEATVQAERLPNGRIRFTGSYPLRMSDFDVTPPTAMFGALRTGDAVVVHFELVG